MCYTPVNKLMRISTIQNITLEHTRRGATQEWVYENLIHPVFFISRRTYYHYLGTNARRDLRQMHEEGMIKTRHQSAQLTLSF